MTDYIGRKGEDCQPRILYPVKITFKNESEIKIVSDQKKKKKKVRALITNRSALKEILKEVFLIEGKVHQKDANLALYKGMKTISGRNVDKYKS